MLSFILFLTFIFENNGFFLHMKTNIPKTTNWNSFQFSIKERARNWFIERAIKNGIPWKELYKDYDSKVEDINSYKEMNENKNQVYPDYYLMPFHGYDDGNMNWKAAKEAEAATLSISANYWKNTDPYVAQEWMRQNISANVYDYVARINNKKTPKHLLDMGCSTGISTEYLKKTYPSSIIHGIDLSPYFIGVASYQSRNKKLGINYLHGNAEDTNYQPDSFDIIVCNFLFHELPEDAAQNVLNEAYRILRKDGVFAVIDMDPSHLEKQLGNNPFRKWAFESTEPHIYNYYLRNMTTMFQNALFQQVEKVRNDPLNSVWLGVKGGESDNSQKENNEKSNKNLNNFIESEKKNENFEEIDLKLELCI